jgi:Sec-independent protein translocase protein TatA
MTGRSAGGKKMKGQLSAEMLILIVVVLAIVGIAATQLVGTAKDTGASIRNQTDRIDRLTTEAMKSQSGEACVSDDDCIGGLCEDYRCG